MSSDKEKVRVLLAQFPLESHSRGAFTVANMLRDSGMEVVYIGNSLPEQIVGSAVQENVDVVGISTLTGGELVLGEKVMKLAQEKGIRDSVVFVMGGIFPPEDEPKLKEMGFEALFTPGATREGIANAIKDCLGRKRGAKV
jgi:methylmalonyl-CoA mutase C-terminal domain/subunit